MLWRMGHEPIKLENRILPNALREGILIGGFGAASLRPFLVWKRLVDTSLPGRSTETILVAPKWSTRDRSGVLAAFPPSLRDEVILFEDPARQWETILGVAEGTFVAHVSRGKAELVIVGGPTDQGWDLLEASVHKWAK